MNTLKTVSKYTHILYYITAFVVSVDFALIMVAPHLQMRIAGTVGVLGAILGLISTFFVIREKAFIQLIINIIIPIALFLIFLFGLGI